MSTKSNAKSTTKSAKSSKSQRKDQLTDLIGFDGQRIIFDSVSEEQIPGQKMTYKRINIGVLNPDGSEGSLIIPTLKCFSFGINEFKDENGKISRTLSLSLWDRENPTKEQKEWTDTFTKEITNTCAAHLMSVKDEIGFDEDFLKAYLKSKFDPFYWKKEKGSNKPLPGTGPTLNAKLIESGGKKDKKNGDEVTEKKIISQFHDAETGKDMNPLDMVGKYGHVEAALKIESIWIGSDKAKLQVKLWEANVELVGGGGVKPLLPRQNVPTKILSSKDDGSDEELDVEDKSAPKKSVSKKSASPKGKAPQKNDEDADVEDGSLHGSDDDVEEEKPKPKPIRKIVKKVPVKPKA